MSRPVRVNPIFYNRLTWAVEDLGGGLGYEIEFVAHHLETVKEAFAQRWDDQTPVPGQPAARLITGTLGDHQEILFAVTARLMNDGSIEIRNVTLMTAR